jgi:hypothetical protein
MNFGFLELLLLQELVARWVRWIVVPASLRPAEVCRLVPSHGSGQVLRNAHSLFPTNSQVRSEGAQSVPGFLLPFVG